MKKIKNIKSTISSDEAEMLEYFERKLQEETMIPKNRFDESGKMVCNCGEVVWLFKDSGLCPKCKEVLFKIK